MSPRTARCCQAVQQIRIPIDNVWITESVLSAAFERYCHATRAARRHATSLPGPLESRRRLGKMRMGSLYSMELQPTFPPWAIEFPVDLRSWKWQPPTARELREEKIPKRDPSATRRSVDPGVLESEPAGTKVKEDDKTSTVHNTATEDNISAKDIGATTPFVEELHELRLSIIAHGVDNPKSKFQLFVGGLKQRLVSGLLSKADVDMALDTVPAALAELCKRSKVGNSQLQFFSAVIQGLQVSSLEWSMDLDGAWWNALLSRTASLKDPRLVKGLSELIVSNPPVSDLNQIGYGLAAIVQSLISFSYPTMNQNRRMNSICSHLSSSAKGARVMRPEGAWESYRSTHHRTLANDLGSILRGVSSDQHNETLAIIQYFLVDYGRRLGHAGRRELHLAWLWTLARMPLVSQEYLLDTAYNATVYTPAHELWQVLLRYWSCHEYFAKSDAQHLFAAKLFTGSTKLRHLFGIVCRSTLGPRQRAHLDNIYKALFPLRMENALLQALDGHLDNRGSAAIEVGRHLALASNDHTLALQIYSTFRTKISLREIGRIWDWRDWSGYVQGMIADPTVSPDAIWEVVGIGSAKLWRRGGDYQGDRKRREELVANMALWFTQAPNISNKRAFNHVFRCIQFFVTREIRVPVTALVALSQIVMSDMKRGWGGNSTWFRMLRDYLKQNAEPAEGNRVMRELKRWRAFVEVRKRRLGPLEAAEDGDSAEYSDVVQAIQSALAGEPAEVTEYTDAAEHADDPERHPEHADDPEHAKYADYAEYAEFADAAEFAEFARFAEIADYARAAKALEEAEALEDAEALEAIARELEEKDATKSPWDP